MRNHKLWRSQESAGNPLKSPAFLIFQVSMRQLLKFSSEVRDHFSIPYINRTSNTCIYFLKINLTRIKSNVCFVTQQLGVNSFVRAKLLRMKGIQILVWQRNWSQLSLEHEAILEKINGECRLLLLWRRLSLEIYIFNFLIYNNYLQDSEEWIRKTKRNNETLMLLNKENETDWLTWTMIRPFMGISKKSDGDFFYFAFGATPITANPTNGPFRGSLLPLSHGESTSEFTSK